MRTSRPTPALLAPASALLALALLAGCAGDESSGPGETAAPTSSPATSGAPSPSADTSTPSSALSASGPVRAIPEDYQYLCELVPAAEVAEASGIEGLATTDERSATAQLPARDLCRYLDPSTQAAVTVGVGVLPASAEDVAALRESPRYFQTVDLPELGDSAFFAPQAGTIVFLAGDRLLEVGYDGAPVSREQLVATGQLLADSADELEPAPPKVVLPVCDALVDEVEAVLAAPVAVRRDRQEGGTINCGFATSAGSVTVGHSTGQGQGQQLQEYFESLPGVEEVPGIGQAAYYAPGEGAVVLADDETAGFQVEPAPEKLTPELEALLRATADFA